MELKTPVASFSRLEGAENCEATRAARGSVETRTPVAFLSGNREVAEGFNATGATHHNKKIVILLHLAPKAGAEEWIKYVLATIAERKKGNGRAIQILSVTEKDWNEHASIAPSALDALRRFRARRPRYKLLSLDRSLSWAKLECRVKDVQEDFGADLQNIERLEDGVLIESMQRVGGLILPPEFEGELIGLHMSKIPKESHYQMQSKAHRSKRFKGYTPVDARVRYKGVGGTIGVGVSFAPNGDPDDISSQIVSAFRRGYMYSSWSWGNPSRQVNAATRALNQHAIDYVTCLGGLVGFASGDEGPNDGTSKPDVDNPAEYTWSLVYGGTALYRGLTGPDRYWNDNPRKAAAGYGHSRHYDAPYQKRRRRRVPDIAGPASAKTGFLIYGGGKKDVAGGTSVIPWAMKEIAKVSAKLGLPLGALHPWLYRYAKVHKLTTPVLNRYGKVDLRCGLGTPIFENWLVSLERLVEAGRALPVPAGFRWASFRSRGAALHIGELGGGFKAEELNHYCDMIGVPHIVADVWGVNGGRNHPQGLENDSGEVVLDMDMVADANDPRSWREVPIFARSRRAKTATSPQKKKVHAPHESKVRRIDAPQRRKKAA
jgi:hypothetical protein